MNHESTPLHPAIRDLQSDLQRGSLTRREFLRFATLLGTSVATSYALAACGAPAEMDISTVAEETAPRPARHGGVLRIGTSVPRTVDHPARLSWLESANQIRQVAEYLTETRADGTTRPWLLERWEVDDDVKTWTLRLRRGIQFNNGDPLTVDDLIFNFNEWLDPAKQSSMLGLLALDRNGVERIDDYTVRLHLKAPQISVPEHLFHYPALILHHGFEGDFIAQPVGTGPFLLEEYLPGERATFVRRPDYWGGPDNLPLPYLDRLEYLDLSPEDRTAAMQGGVIDTLINPNSVDWEALRVTPELNVLSVKSSHAIVLRMRVDQEPWTDLRVRNALKLCQDRQKILQVSFYGQGDLAFDAHVAPVHPAFCEQPVPDYNPEQARALLAEAGYPDGLSVTLTTKNDQGEPEMARALKELAAPGGFTLNLNIVEPARYWEEWTEVNLGLTSWFHRPLSTMNLALGYTITETGEFPPWNETRWSDAEFERLLREAEQTLDVAERRRLMCEIETIMQERGPIGISFWRYIWNIMRREFHGAQAHPNSYDLFYAVWKEDNP